MKAFIVVEKGTPYKKGDVLPIRKEKIVIGRFWEDNKPDFSFDSPYVSRSHIMIECDKESYTLTDAKSKHGTKVNKKEIEKGAPCELKHLDKISMAKDEVVLVFCCGIDPGETLDFSLSSSKRELVLNEERHEVLLKGSRLNISGKIYELLYLLVQNKNCAVSEEEIKRVVWSERARDDKGEPFVTEEEVNMLVYRLRKELGDYGSVIKTIRGYGYMLELAT